MSRQLLRFAAVAVILTIELALGACSSSKNGGSTPALNTNQIGATGGSVTTANGSGVTIPPGALGSSVNVTVEVDPNAPAPPSAWIAVGPTYLVGPEGQQFSQPVTVTIAFDPARLPTGKTAHDISVLTSPATGTPSYGPLTTTEVDSTHISAPTTHFSYFMAVVPNGVGNVDAGAETGSDSSSDAGSEASATDGSQDSTTADALPNGDGGSDAGDAPVLDASTTLEGGDGSTTATDSSTTNAGLGDGTVDAPPEAGSGEAGLVCAQPANPAPPISNGYQCGYAPIPAGGTIVDGTYFLTSGVRYPQGDAGCGGAPAQNQCTLVVAGGEIALVQTNDPSWYVGPYSVSGTSLTFVNNCGNGGFPNATIGYTATRTGLTLFIPCGGCTPQVGMNVASFTKQ